MITTANNDVCPLSRFVEQVSQGQRGNGLLTVNHLKVGIREERMSELSDWSNCDLDALELHAVKFDGGAALTDVFGIPFDRYPVDNGRSVSGICAPSPYAWT